MKTMMMRLAMLLVASLMVACASSDGAKKDETAAKPAETGAPATPAEEMPPRDQEAAICAKLKKDNDCAACSCKQVVGSHKIPEIDKMSGIQGAWLLQIQGNGGGGMVDSQHLIIDANYGGLKVVAEVVNAWNPGSGSVRHGGKVLRFEVGDMGPGAVYEVLLENEQWEQDADGITHTRTLTLCHGDAVIRCVTVPTGAGAAPGSPRWQLDVKVTDTKTGALTFKATVGADKVPANLKPLLTNSVGYDALAKTHPKAAKERVLPKE